MYDTSEFGARAPKFYCIMINGVKMPEASNNQQSKQIIIILLKMSIVMMIKHFKN